MWVYLIPKLIYPLNNISFCFSVFLTVLIAAERYLAVCHPITYRQTTVSRTRSERLFFFFVKNAWDKFYIPDRLLLYLLPVFLLSVGLNIPKFFETEIVTSPVFVEDR